MEVWFRSFSFLNGGLVGSMLIFQGVSPFKHGYFGYLCGNPPQKRALEPHQKVKSGKSSAQNYLWEGIPRHVPSSLIGGLRFWSRFYLLEGRKGTNISIHIHPSSKKKYLTSWWLISTHE